MSAVALLAAEGSRASWVHVYISLYLPVALPVAFEVLVSENVRSSAIVVAELPPAVADLV